VSFLGVLSYSLYLVHHVVLDALEPALGAGVLRAAVALALSVGIAWAIYELIEKPCAQVRRRLSQLAPRSPVRSFEAGDELTSLVEARPR
jgi:peptidoglycan/LPS O-acetylase OafA/YrhL